MKKFFKRIRLKPNKPKNEVRLCEECYYPDLNQYIRAHAPKLWDKWVKEGRNNLKQVNKEK